MLAAHRRLNPTLAATASTAAADVGDENQPVAAQAAVAIAGAKNNATASTTAAESRIATIARPKTAAATAP
jgi:hypothetical protein